MSTEIATRNIDPQALITKALDKGATVETLERLVALATTMRQVTAREAWFEAMSEFQRECPAIKKDASARIATRMGGVYSYTYATLPTILEVVEPLLGKLGLSVSWRQKHEGQAVSASCVVAHKLGHQEESGYITMPYLTDGGRMNPAQAVGSALTYARRYSLLAILGLAPEDDDDAQGTAVGGEKEIGPRVAPSAAPADSGQRLDPDDPALVAEAEELFPDPEKDQLIQECGALIKSALVGKKIKQSDVREFKKTYLGDENADPTKCDVAALGDLHTYLKARFQQ